MNTHVVPACAPVTAPREVITVPGSGFTLVGHSAPPPVPPAPPVLDDVEPPVPPPEEVVSLLPQPAAKARPRRDARERDAGERDRIRRR